MAPIRTTLILQYISHKFKKNPYIYKLRYIDKLFFELLDNT